jgi:methylthioribose-1-phosphate isomerase
VTSPIAPVRFVGDRLILLDQTLLPGRELDREYTRWEDVADAIRTLVVRGAPAIGVAAAFGVVLAARASRATSTDGLLADLEVAVKGLAATRPTAVNLFWALDRMRRTAAALGQGSVDEMRARLAGEAADILSEDLAANRALGDHALQRGRAGHRRLWHGARGGPLGTRERQAVAALGGRDAARDAGVAAHGVGVCPGGDPAPSHRRRGGGLGDGARTGRPGRDRG